MARNPSLRSQSFALQIFGFLGCRYFHPTRPLRFDGSTDVPTLIEMMNLCKDSFIDTIRYGSSLLSYSNIQEIPRQEMSNYFFNNNASSTIFNHVILKLSELRDLGGDVTEETQRARELLAQYREAQRLSVSLADKFNNS